MTYENSSPFALQQRSPWLEIAFLPMGVKSNVASGRKASWGPHKRNYAYVSFADLEMEGAAQIISRAALRIGCCCCRYCGDAGRDHAPLPFAASVHFFFNGGHCYHVLVLWGRSGSGCFAALVPADERFFCSVPNLAGQRLFGILPDHLCDIRDPGELVQCFTSPRRAVMYCSTGHSGTPGHGEND